MLSGFFSSGLRVDTVAISEPNLQGVFLKLTGKELRD
jgi:hypothetical protein